jgi:hypothetical protein
LFCSLWNFKIVHLFCILCINFNSIYGREHPIAYGGRSLCDSELKWHITDKETLTLVEGIQHFKHYLVNNEFTVYTDNVSVKYLQKIKDFQGQIF